MQAQLKMQGGVCGRGMATFLETNHNINYYTFFFASTIVRCQMMPQIVGHLDYCTPQFLRSIFAICCHQLKTY